MHTLMSMGWWEGSQNKVPSSQEQAQDEGGGEKSMLSPVVPACECEGTLQLKGVGVKR